MNRQQRGIRFSLLLIVLVSVLGAGFATSASVSSASATAAARSQMQIQTQPQNQTDPTVELDTSNNTTAKTIHISEARLPSGGFVAIHDEAYTNGVVHGSEITVSNYLAPGTYHDIRIPVNRSVPGGNNVSRLNFTEANLTAVLYRDTNDNQRFDFAESFGETDSTYQENETKAVSDTELVTFEANQRIAQQRSQPAPASLQFDDQELQRSSGSAKLTLRNVTLSKGGFIAVHDQRDLPPTNNPLNSTVGLSRYLKPGIHRNVTIRLLNGSIKRTQTLVAIPYLDTNHNQQFDYVECRGETDYAYLSQQAGSATVVNQTAKVQVPASSQNQNTQTRRSLLTSTTTAGNTSNGVVTTDVATDTRAESTTGTTTQSAGQSSSGSILSNDLFYIVDGVIVVGIAVVIIWGFERRS